MLMYNVGELPKSNKPWRMIGYKAGLAISNEEFGTFFYYEGTWTQLALNEEASVAAIPLEYPIQWFYNA